MAGGTLSTNLPLALTSFVGRQREMVEVRRLVFSTRLLTLTGAGGSGKTRLAVQVASDLLDAFAHGVWLVELAPLGNAALIPQLVANSLGIRESPGTSLDDSLIRYLQPKHLMLVLDNCEHLVEACAPLIERWLRAGPELKVLTTSREDLAVPGEVCFRVPNLTLPDPQHLPPLETLATYEAVRLFVERAQAARPEFRLTEANAKSVAKICAQLDGMPLAIELAATRVHTMAVQQIAARLDDRFRLLTTGARTVLPRQQTLRATVDWSYDLLPAEEQILLGRLSVFAGGWTLEAAEDICGGDGVEKAQVVDLLGHLVTKSLAVVQEQSSEARFGMLETVRMYAREKLIRSGEIGRIQTRHLDFFLRLTEEADPHLRTFEQIRWLDRLDLELDNLRAALEWSIGAGETERGLRMSSALTGFWYRRGYLSEGRDWFDRLLRKNENASIRARADALCQAASLASSQQDIAKAIAYSMESLALYRQLEDEKGIAKTLAALGHAYHIAGDAERAMRHLEESLALYEELDDEWGKGTALLWLADSYTRQGNLKHAAALAERSLGLFRELGDGWGIAFSLGNVGEIARRQGDYDQAAARFKESLALHQRTGTRADIPFSLEALAIVMSLKGHSGLAASLWGAGEAVRQAISTPVPSTYSMDYASFIAEARARLGDEAFNFAWEEGHRMSLEQAVDAGLAAAEQVKVVEPLPQISERIDQEGERAALRIYALGQVHVQRGSQEIAASNWRYAKARELFFYLLCTPPRTREQIGLDLWPDASAAQLRGNLKVTLYHLRHALGRPNCILFENDQYNFNRDMDYWFDMEAFRSGLGEARRLETREPEQALEVLERTIRLYRGDFLAGWKEGEWYLPLQEELRREYGEGLMLLGQWRFARGEYVLAAKVYRKAIAHDSYQETAHRELMRSLARQGEPGLALRDYQDLVKLLRDDLGAPPSPETKALYERLKQGEQV